MTPAARAQAAILVLDRILAGEPAEKALTNWGRAARYAGSSDRAKVRDIVFQALRCQRSQASLGGGMTGRGLVLGGLRAAGEDARIWFDGSPHGPAVPAADEVGAPPEGAAALDLPDWLLAPMQAALGPDLAAVARALRQRAPVFLRVNARRMGLADAQATLRAEGIETAPHPLANFALQVLSGERKISSSQAYLSGLVELQDAASQAVAEAVPLADGQRLLDLCAGGGGKTLALAARARLQAFAHDVTPARMADLPARARRAGVAVKLLATPEKAAPFDVVLTDVPCSGSGSWRRDPEGKWRLTAARLEALLALQSGILDRAAGLVAPGGVLAYATCSLLRAENDDQVAAFLSRSPGWTLRQSLHCSPLQGGDGMALFVLQKS